MVREARAKKTQSGSKAAHASVDVRKSESIDVLIAAQGTKPFDASRYPPSFVPDDFDPDEFIALINEEPTEPNGED